MLPGGHGRGEALYLNEHLRQSSNPVRKEWGCLELQAGKLEACPEETASPRTHFSWQNVIAEHEIRNISCAAQDPEDLCTFAYITKDLQTSHHYCHVFSTVDVVSVPVTVAPAGSGWAWPCDVQRSPFHSCEWQHRNTHPGPGVTGFPTQVLCLPSAACQPTVPSSSFCW